VLRCSTVLRFNDSRVEFYCESLKAQLENLFLPTIVIHIMNPNKVIYHIKNDRKLTEIWSHFSREEKEDVLERMKNQEIADIEKVLLEIKTGQNRLF
jgi:hypothetical protein